MSSHPPTVAGRAHCWRPTTPNTTEHASAEIAAAAQADRHRCPGHARPRTTACSPGRLELPELRVRITWFASFVPNSYSLLLLPTAKRFPAIATNLIHIAVVRGLVVDVVVGQCAGLPALAGLFPVGSGVPACARAPARGRALVPLLLLVPQSSCP